jgi:hypothetical protein
LVWRDVFIVSLGALCILGGSLHIRHPERLANNWLFSHLSIAGLLLSRRGLLTWVRILGAVIMVIGAFLILWGTGWLTASLVA